MFVIVPKGPLSVDAAARECGVQTYDCALPQPWVDEFQAITGFNPVGNFVWSYDRARVFGEPRPLTVKGHVALRKWDRANGTHYLVEDAPIVLPEGC